MDKRNKTRIILSWLAILVWGIIAFSLSRQDGASTKSLSVGLTMQILRLYYRFGFSANLELIHSFLRKLAHVVIYLGFGGLLYHAFACTWRKRPGWMLGISSLLCMAIASVDEMQKALIPGRHCDPEEILLNCIAALAGNLIAYTWMQRRSCK